MTPCIKQYRTPTRSENVARHADTLRHFDSLPDSANVSIAVLAALDGRCLQSAWRDVKAGRLPRPIKVGHSTRFNVGEFRALRRARGAQ